MVELTIGAVVVALVMKAAEKVGEAAGDALAGVVQTVRNLFRKKGDLASEKALDNLLDVPDSPTRAKALASGLDGYASQDPDFKAELERLVEDAKSSGVTVDNIAQTIWGNMNVQIGVANQSEIKIAQHDGGEPVR